MSKIAIKGLWSVLKDAGKNLMKDKVPKLAASLAYYTVFSIGPMLIVIIYLANLFYGREAIEGTLFGQLSKLLGEKAAFQIQEIISNATISGSNFTAVIGFGALLIAATTVFAEIQDSINTIWKLRVKPERSWLIVIRSRLLSFSLIVSLGFLLLVSLVINSLLDGLIDKIVTLFPHLKVVVIYIINLTITFFVITTLFAIIFKVLPDAVIEWRDVITGAMFTATLFMIGKFGITLYIRSSDIGSTYGTAGSLVILLLWVYYSSIILYFGAEFTKSYAVEFGATIRPNEYAVTYNFVSIDTDKDSIQENEKQAKKTEEQLQKPDSSG